MSKDQKIKVTWSMASPPVAARRWVDISTFKHMQKVEDKSVEHDLGLTEGTIGYLRAGFTANLNRYDGWDCSGAGDEHQKAAVDAARLFKRGVATKSTATSATVSNSNDKYSVTIMATDAGDSANPGKVDLSEVIPLDTHYLIIDANVKHLWGADILRCKFKNPPTEFVVQLNEVEKTLESVARIVKAAPSQVPGKTARWCVVGGGVLTDVAAFAAGLSGAEITFVPTTLLAMVDASIGGKTGVNFPPFGKNQVGLFYFPKEVRVWPGWLRTLAAREIAAGAAECLKHAYLSKEAALSNLFYRNFASALSNSNLSELTSYLPGIVRLKADVVTEDPAETGHRATLNLGHTLAHALEAEALAAQLEGKFESAPAEQILHGEAVAIGLVYAIILSQSLCGFSESQKSLVFESLKIAKCWVDRSTLARGIASSNLDSTVLWASLWSRMCGDKKQTLTNADSTDFVLLSELGSVYRTGESWTKKVTEAQALSAWLKLLQLI